MSLRLLLLGAFAYVLVLILVALEVPLALNLSRRVDAEVRSEAAGQAHLVAAAASGRLQDRRELERLVGEAASDLGGRVIVVDARGRLRADSAGSGLRAAFYGDRPEIRAALAGRTAHGERHSNTLDEDLLFTAVPVTNAGRRTGAVRITQSVEAVRARVRRDILALAGVGALALALGLALAWALAGSLSRPLRRLAATARRVEQGDLDARAEVTGSSEQREVARAFNDMTARLAQVLEAQREFVANASHQLRTPLTGLRLRLEAATLKTGDPDLARELAAAEYELERLSRLLNALLTLANEGQRAAVARPVALADAAASAAERWQGQAEQRGSKLAITGTEEAWALASEEDVAIVLDNLIENALVYSPAARSVTVEWGRAGDSVYLAVADEGPGIASGEETRVFERFWRGSASRSGASGTGLGLAIVQALARRWGGSAQIENRPEGGARAEIRLPAAGADALPAANRELGEPLHGRV